MSAAEIAVVVLFLIVVSVGIWAVYGLTRDLGKLIVLIASDRRRDE